MDYDARVKLVLARYRGRWRARPRTDIQRLGAAGATSVPALVTILGDSKRSVSLRAAAAWLLGQLQEPRASVPLVQAMRRAEATALTWEAANALANIDRTNVVRPLIGLLRGGRGEQRIAAAYALGRLADSRASPILIRVLKEPSADDRLRDYAVEALGLCGGRGATTLLMEALRDPAPEVRGSAAYGLGQLGYLRALPQLRRLTRREVEPNRQVREFARDAVAEFTRLAEDRERVKRKRRNSGQRK